jgi:hypothetical protein
MQLISSQCSCSRGAAELSVPHAFLGQRALLATPRRKGCRPHTLAPTQAFGAAVVNTGLGPQQMASAVGFGLGALFLFREFAMEQVST